VSLRSLEARLRKLEGATKEGIRCYLVNQDQQDAYLDRQAAERGLTVEQLQEQFDVKAIRIRTGIDRG